jgi:hypothetical protein
MFRAAEGELTYNRRAIQDLSDGLGNFVAPQVSTPKPEKLKPWTPYEGREPGAPAPGILISDIGALSLVSPPKSKAPDYPLSPSAQAPDVHSCARVLRRVEPDRE